MVDTGVQLQTFDQAVAQVRALLDAAEPEDPAGGLENLQDTLTGFGSYDGLPPHVALEEDGRSGTLLKPLTYNGPDGGRWPVPEGAWLDGASIPSALWTIVGSPYTGKYRNASIVHDHYCVIKERTWRDTHRMFHDAMRCSGVSRTNASVMFYAVHRFGPRWTVPGLESLAGDAAASPLSSAAAEELLRDAEAIVTHGLDTEEVAALAETREASAATASPLEALGEAALEGVSIERARLLVVPGGSGTAEDVAAVTEGALKLPGWVVDHFLASKIRIVACRNSVTDFEKDLQGVTPRGWDKIGRTWDSVPGSYFDGKKRVVVATVEQAGKRVVPSKATRLHGSDDLVVHESLHGYDYSTRHAVLSTRGFLDARNADDGGLTSYEAQAGQAGLEETFAETGAQFCIDPALLAGRCPALAAFWQTMPVGEEGIAAAPPAEERQPIGSVTRGQDGSLLFDLRALGAGGAIGHAVVTIAPGEPRHEQLESELFGSEEGLEAMPASTALFYG